jgi:hypothetical protein
MLCIHSTGRTEYHSGEYSAHKCQLGKEVPVQMAQAPSKAPGSHVSRPNPMATSKIMLGPLADFWGPLPSGLLFCSPKQHFILELLSDPEAQPDVPDSCECVCVYVS